MSKIVYDIFISYRREGGGATAGRINDMLTADGYSVSYDVDTLREGRFDMQLLERIEQCQDFILVVDKNCFVRTIDPATDPQDDWLWQELSYALQMKKNIIPVLLAGANFPKQLPENINDVRFCQGPTCVHEYFDSFYAKLKGYLHAYPRMERIQQGDSAATSNRLPNLKLKADIDCFFYLDGEERLHLKAGIIQKMPLAVGQYILKFVSSENSADFIEIDFDMPDAEKVQKVCLREVRNKRCEKEAEEKRKEELRIAEEKAKRKAEAKVLNDKGCKYYQQEKIDDAVECWHKAAKYGNVDAQFHLGKLYQEGQGVEQSYDEAVKWYSVAAENEHVEAQGKLGICYFNGSGVEKDYSMAAKWLTKTAEQGNSEAQFYIGYMYDLGLGVNTDYSIAADWYQKSAEQGNMNAWLYLAYLNITEKGIKRDSDKLLKEIDEIDNNKNINELVDVPFLQKAANLGDAKSQCILGYIRMVNGNANEAKEWFQLAANQDNEWAEVALGVISYDEGKYGDSHMWYQKAAQKKNPFAYWGLAVLYNGYAELTKDINKELKLLELAGHYSGMPAYLYKCIGDCYEELHDYNEALKWYKIAQEKGEDVKWALERVEKKIEEAKRQAELELKRKQEEEERIKAEEKAKRAEAIKIEARENYNKGEEFFKKGMYAEAVKWYRKAAEQGYANAQFNLGYMYQYGKGVPQSDEEAVKWYRKAVEQGNADAKDRITEIAVKKNEDRQQVVREIQRKNETDAKRRMEESKRRKKETMRKQEEDRIKNEETEEKTDKILFGIFLFFFTLGSVGGIIYGWYEKSIMVGFGGIIVAYIASFIIEMVATGVVLLWQYVRNKWFV